MQYAELITAIERETWLTGEDAKQSIRDYILEGILDLARIRCWDKLQEAVTLNFNDEDEYDLELLFADTWDISAVSLANNTISISGNVYPIVAVGDALVIADSTGNDGNYTVSAVAYTAGATVVTFTESLSDATVDGTAAFVSRPEPLHDIVAILNTAEDRDYGEYSRLDYKDYLRLTDSAGHYAIRGTTLYITGEISVPVLYESHGDEPDEDDDESKPLKYYWDIIKWLAIMAVHTRIGDTEKLALAKAMLEQKLSLAESKENRMQKLGMRTTVARR